MRFLQFLLSLSLTVLLAYGGNTRFGTVPPVGKFLDPFRGFWQNSEGKDPQLDTLVKLPDLKGKASIVYDDRWVPHIFAENDYDLYFLQGYATARHRLWQMEFQTHAAAGRISEILATDQTLALDRATRRKGMTWAAQQALAAMDSVPQLRETCLAYAAGVNAWIAQLNEQTLPLEYKLLDYRPEPWTPLKTALLLKYMANTLASSDGDLEATNALNTFGRPLFDLLYPEQYPGQAPVVPTREHPWTFAPLKIEPPTVPGAPATARRAAPEAATWPQLDPAEARGIGSNNWAVAGRKTASGHPILCDDPHLTLSLPSIWYEVQLTAPGIHCYGASLPGSPAIIIGFNDSVAWGVTNAQRDVLDWYKIKFRDGRQREYWLDGQWKPTRPVVEEIKRRGQAPVYDTVYYTVWGPISFDRSFRPESGKAGHALRWVAHDPSVELLTYLQLNRARNFRDFEAALDHFDCPAQNFVFAATNGDIAIRVQGKYPAKWRGQGKFLLDGSTSANRWQGFIPDQQNAQMRNPAQGYVSSANQHPADSLYPYYVYSNNYEYYRNRRINTLLDTMQRITPEAMMRMQNDNFNLQAAESLPFFLSKIDQTQLTPAQAKVYDLLKGWDFFNQADSEAASYHEAWWDKLYPLVWDEMNHDSLPLRFPAEFVTIKLLKERDSFPLFDVQSTKAEKETGQDLIRRSFAEAVDSVARWQQAHGNRPPRWADYKATTIAHLVPLLGPLGVANVQNGGNHGIVNATSSRNGPSWRMVVELDPQGVKAWGVYPGGQVGNPGSPAYAEFIDRWRQAKPYELYFMTSAEEKNARVRAKQGFSR